MTELDQFLTSISSEVQPDPSLSDCLQALWWAQKGNWDKAHDLAQDEGTSSGDWIHAYLHRLEGDLGNAAYWYNRALTLISEGRANRNFFLRKKKDRPLY